MSMEYTKKSNIAVDSIVLMFVQCITLLTGIIQTMLLSRALTKVEYGTYSQGVLIINFVTPFILLGMGNAINYFYNQGNGKKIRKKYVDTIFAVVTIVGLMTGIMIVMLRTTISSYFGNKEIYPLLVFIAFRPVLKNLISLYQPLYISNQMAKQIAIRNLIVGILQVGIIFVALLFSKNLVLIFGLLLVLDFFQVIAFGIVFEKHAFKIDILRVEREFLPEIFKYAITMMLSTMVGTISKNMDKMLIGRALSTEEFAIYSNMAKELPFAFVVSSLTTIVTPVLIRLKASGKQEEMKKIWSKYIEIGYITTSILIVGALICAEELIVFLYSDQYIEGKSVFIIYLLVEMFRFTHYGMILTVYGKTKQVLYFSVLSLLLNFVLNFILLDCFGMIGPAIATLLSNLLLGWLQLYLGGKIMQIKWKDIINVKYLASFFLKLLMVSGTVMFFKCKVLINIESNFMKLIIAYGIFVSFMIMLEYRKIKQVMLELNSGY